MQYVCIKSTFSRYFDLSEILILASSANRCPANSCFCREHSFDILERTNLLNLQQENAIKIMPTIFPCLLIMKYNVHYLILLPKAFRYPLSASKTIALLNPFP